jgi:hypothetical protein
MHRCHHFNGFYWGLGIARERERERERGARGSEKREKILYKMLDFWFVDEQWLNCLGELL